jgi:hypothetical protein
MLDRTSGGILGYDDLGYVSLNSKGLDTVDWTGFKTMWAHARRRKEYRWTSICTNRTVLRTQLNRIDHHTQKKAHSGKLTKQQTVDIENVHV